MVITKQGQASVSYNLISCNTNNEQGAEATKVVIYQEDSEIEVTSIYCGDNPISEINNDLGTLCASAGFNLVDLQVPTGSYVGIPIGFIEI